jgi:hypothetical protein
LVSIQITKQVGGGLTVTILDTSHLQHLFGSGGGNDTGTSGWISVFVQLTMIRLRRRRTSRDKSTHDGTGLSGNLHGDSVGLGDMRTPVTSSNGNDGELGVDDGTSDGTGDFLGTLHSESDVSRISAVSISPIGRASLRIGGEMSILWFPGHLHACVPPTLAPLALRLTHQSHRRRRKPGT